MCREVIGQRFPEMSSQVELKVQDFFQYNGLACDAVVLDEILEHIEDPRLFLDKVPEITNEGLFIYITTVVNCPQIIYIFSVMWMRSENCTARWGLRSVASCFAQLMVIHLKRRYKRKRQSSRHTFGSESEQIAVYKVDL